MRRIIATSILAVLAVSGMILAFATAGNNTALASLPPGKVRLCHATGSATNPYVLIEVADDAAFHGHLGADHQDGRDIIPPFEYKGESYSQNWDANGQAIFNNGCNAVTTTVTTPGTTTVVTGTTGTVTLPGTTVTTPGQTVTTPATTVTTPGQTVTTPGQTVTAPGQTVTTPGQTVTVAQPGTTVTTPGQTVTQPGQTVTQPGATVTTPGQTTTVTTPAKAVKPPHRPKAHLPKPPKRVTHKPTHAPYTP